MTRHTEQIVDYIIDGSDLIYNDNHGALVRCHDCEYYDAYDGSGYCRNEYGLAYPRDEAYCSNAERKEEQ